MNSYNWIRERADLLMKEKYPNATFWDQNFMQLHKSCMELATKQYSEFLSVIGKKK